jgi:cytochrome P450
MRLGPYNAFIVNHPDYLRHVLVSNVQNYSKNTPPYRMLREFLNDGLLTSDGEFWQRQRRLMQPSFHRDKLAGFADVMVRAAQDMVASWRRRDGALRVHDQMMHLTLRIVCKTLFAVDDLESIGEFTDALEHLNRDAYARFTARVPLPPVLPTLRDYKVRRARRVVTQFVESIVRARRREGPGGPDLLSMLIEATDSETHETMSDEQLRDEVMILLFAGYETTANALTWTWYLLARHPEIRGQVEAELDAALPSGAPALADLPRLRWVGAVIQEALRLYPPAWRFTRRAEQDDRINGHEIPKGSIMLVLPYALHRNPALWPNPEAFDPRRFLDSKAAPPFTYLPFGAGRRICIGMQYALMEAQLVVATVAREVRLDLFPGHRVEEEAGMTLVPRYGVLANLAWRTS